MNAVFHFSIFEYLKDRMCPQVENVLTLDLISPFREEQGTLDSYSESRVSCSEGRDVTALVYTRQVQAPSYL